MRCFASPAAWGRGTSYSIFWPGARWSGSTSVLPGYISNRVLRRPMVKIWEGSEVARHISRPFAASFDQRKAKNVSKRTTRRRRITIRRGGLHLKRRNLPSLPCHLRPHPANPFLQSPARITHVTPFVGRSFNRLGWPRWWPPALPARCENWAVDQRRLGGLCRSDHGFGIVATTTRHDYYAVSDTS